MKNHVYRYDNVIIGGNLASIIFAYLNDYHIIITQPVLPYPIEYFDIGRDLTRLKIEYTDKALISPTGEVPFGFNKCDLYENLYYRLAMRGKIIYELSSQSIRVNRENNLIRIVSDRSRLYHFRYKKLFTFLNNITGLEFDVETKYYDIYNWFKVTRCFMHGYECLAQKESGIIDSGMFLDNTTLITSTRVEKEKLDPHIDFYIKNYLEKYLRTVTKSHPKHLTKVVNTKIMKREVLDEKIVPCDNVCLITLSEESILDGKCNIEEQLVSL